jgi:hypothetical protein
MWTQKMEHSMVQDSNYILHLTSYETNLIQHWTKTV